MMGSTALSREPDPLPNDPVVSVVIPAYNAEQFIEHTLDSVRAQTYTRYEVIVVDDGSADGTKRVVDLYLERHGLHGRCIRQENRGIAAARNTGIRAATSELIALLDHDDLWYPEKLDTVMEELASHPDADLVCHNEAITKEGNLVRVSRNGPASERMYERLLFGGNVLSPSASTFRRTKALAIGGFLERPDFQTVEDYDFWMRLSRVARFRFLEKVLGEYVMVERAASRKVEYHHRNLEIMLTTHLAAYFGEHPGVSARWRTRKRVSIVYRSAARQLMTHGELPARQRTFIAKMLRAYPFEPRNLALALLWIVQSLRGVRLQPDLDESA